MQGKLSHQREGFEKYLNGKKEVSTRKFVNAHTWMPAGGINAARTELQGLGMQKD